MSKNQHTILVVDPDERSYKTFESVLGVKNNVLFVPNSKTALDLPDSQLIDMAFISHMLNGISGIEILESFKRRYPSIPVILIAEQPKVDDVITAYRSGARELIVKPIDENELVAVAQKIFGFVSPKKPKRRWFFPVKKNAQAHKAEKKSNEPLEKISDKSKPTQIMPVTENEDAPTKKSVPMAGFAKSQMMVDALIDSLKPVKAANPSAPVEPNHPQIEAFFFGSFQVLVNSQRIEDWPGKKGKSIFAYLLFHHKKKIFRDVLMDLFWHKSSPDSARNCLNVAIHGLRRALQDKDPNNEYILFKDECYYFNSEINIQLDVETFKSIWHKAQKIEHVKNLADAVSEYERAAEIYTGDFLEDELYDDWSSLDKENLKEVYLVILDKISENFMLQKFHQKAIRVGEKILEKDNCREDIYRRLMLCYYREGHRDKAIKLFKKCTKILKDELEVKPTKNTIELFRLIKESQL